MAEHEPRMEELGDAECRQLLTAHHVGRVGLVVEGWPVVLPVNYVFDGRRVAIRSDPGSKLGAIDLGRVAFEVDGIDEGGRKGWSVLVQGRGFDITDALDEVSELMKALPVDPWAPGEKAHWIRIDPERVTGRRLL